MSIDLKPFYDAARAASDEVQRVMTEMSAAFAEGTPEGQQKALDARPTLEAAKAKAKEANEFYLSMRDGAAITDSAAKLFVPAAGVTPAQKAEGAKEMTRAAFESLDPAARMAFMKSGGKLVEPSES
jgi:hypothetical protein